MNFSSGGVRNSNRRCIPAHLVLILVSTFLSYAANAQLGPIRTRGYLEYQYQQNAGQAISDSQSHLGTWRTDVVTYLWAPWVMQIDGSLGVTQAISRVELNEMDRRRSTLLTGRLRTSLFPQSAFPFSAFYEQQDSRVDSEIVDTGLQTTSYGFLQQYAAKRGGRYTLNFRRSDNSRMGDDSSEFRRAFSDSFWQLGINEKFGSNDLRLASRYGKTTRTETNESLNRESHNLRHRLRTSPRFFTDSTAFYSNEIYETDRNGNERKFIQFNGNANWRPDTERPVLVTVRALLQGIDTRSGDVATGSEQALLTTIANYQMTDRLTFSGEVGVGNRSSDNGGLPLNKMDGASAFQRLRTNYRSGTFDLGQFRYRFGGLVEAGNRRDLVQDRGNIRDVLGRLDHTFSRNVFFDDGRQLQLSFAQQITAARTSLNQSRSVFSNTVFGTYARQGGRMSSYLRLSATDRRSSGTERGSSQLVNLQASATSQAGRYRAWNGGLTLQYGRNDESTNGSPMMRSDSISYSANLMYRHANLFDVSNLSFTTELRLLSTDFRTDDPLDSGLGVENERSDLVWRNRLLYRLGLLEFDFHASLREVNDSLSTRVLLKVRRYYGNL